jgi:hypothetical protein
VLLLHCCCAGTQKLLVAKDYEHWIHTGMSKAAPNFLQGLQQLLYPQAGISSMALHTPSSSNGSSSAGYDKAALLAASEMRIGTIFKRRLAQEDPQLYNEPDEAATAEAAGGAAAAAAASSAAGSISNRSSSSGKLPLLSMCLNLNSSLCSSSVILSKVNGGFLLVVYNPLSWSYTWGVRVPVEAGNYSVTGPDGQPVKSQMLPVADSVHLVWPASKAATEESNKPTADLAVVVSAPPLGHAVYKIERLPGQLVTGNGTSSLAHQVSAASELIQLSSNSSSTQQQLMVSSDKLQLEVGQVGISSVKAGNRNISFSAGLIKYQNRFGGSGAYTFKAYGKPYAPLPSEVIVVNGPVLQEVRQRFTDMPGVLTVRLWAGQSHLEVEWTVGQPPGRMDWEVFVRYNTDIKSQGLWFTDANGREYQQRRRQYRPSFDLPASSAELAGNIYPITTGCYQQDNKSAVHVAVDRAQGVVSLADGQMDVHLHRVSAGDDGKGMQEALIDNNAVSGTHIVSFGMPAAADTVNLLHTRRHYEQVRLRQLLACHTSGAEV